MNIKLFFTLLPGLILLNCLPLVAEEYEIHDIPIIVFEEIESFEPYIVPEPTQVLTASEVVESTVYKIPNYGGMKKWLDYRCFSSRTAQGRLQKYAFTDSNGLRQVNGCYCIAIGSRFKTKIGQRIDLVLKNGTVIPCVMGDQKADIHTDTTNTFSNTNRNLCCSEFIVSTKQLTKEAAHRGDTSFIADIWCSPVDKIITYNINILEDIESGEYEEIIPIP